MDSNKILTNFKKITQSDVGRKWILLAGFVLIGLIFISSFFSDGKKSDAKPTVAAIEQAIPMDTYATELEDKVEQLLSQIEGVGKSRVMITMESNTEYVYQAEAKQSSGTKLQQQGDQQYTNERQESIVMVEGDNGKKQALVRTERTPKIKGIAVVCEGGGDIKVESKIIEVLTSVFGISSTRVSVARAHIAKIGTTN